MLNFYFARALVVKTDLLTVINATPLFPKSYNRKTEKGPLANRKPMINNNLWKQKEVKQQIVRAKEGTARGIESKSKVAITLG